MTTPTDAAFDRAFGLWRGAVDELKRARRTVEALERKAREAEQRLLEARKPYEREPMQEAA